MKIIYKDKDQWPLSPHCFFNFMSSFRNHKHLNPFKITNCTLVIIFFIFIILCPILSPSWGGDDKGIHKEGLVNSRIEKQGEKGEGFIKGKGSEGEDKSDESNRGERDDASLYEYQSPSAPEESYVWLIFKTIFVLGALIGVFYYFFRFVTKKAGIQTIGRDVVQVLSIVPIGQNKFIQVIDLAGKILVIGVSDASISLITEIRDRDEIDRIRLLCSSSSPARVGGFQEYISKHIVRIFGGSGSPTLGNDDYRVSAHDRENSRSGYLKRQRDRLKNLGSIEHEK